MGATRSIAVVLLLGLLVGTAPAEAPAAPPPPAAPAAEEPEAPDAAAFEKRWRWPLYLRFGWDDGITYEAGRRLSLPYYDQWVQLFEKQRRVVGRFGGRLHLDAAAFATTGDVRAIPADADVRRAYLATTGSIRTRHPLYYKVEFGVTRQRFFLNAAWLEVRDLWRGMALRVGEFDAPLSLENVTSSNAYPFLEPAQPVGAFAPGTKAGIQLTQGGALGDRTAWTFGYYADAQDVDIGDQTESPARLITRMTFVPRRFEVPERHRLLHLGVSIQYVVSSADLVRYTARPESKLAPELLDTGDIDADQATVSALELAYASGPWLLQTEYLGSNVALEDAAGSNPFFWGGYVWVSRTLTGEARPYDKRDGVFGMLEPSSPVSIRDCRWRGAWEVGVRYSYLTLDSANVRGGNSHALSLGVNWYWNRHLRLMFDYGATLVGGVPDDGSVHVFQTRLQIVY
jgi:phosphate-selective porin OprO/OprP